MTKHSKNRNLTWVYPLDKWISNYQKTFVYGWSSPKTKLLVKIGSTSTKIKVFPNGNFAQTVKLPYKKNVIKLIQILSKKKKVLSRNIAVKKSYMSFPQKRESSMIKLASKSGFPIPLKRGSLQRSGKLGMTSIVIDPGHGGKEHGTHSPKGIPESYFNLQIAKLLFNKLKKKYKNVYLTRTKDKFVSLKQRINFAKKKKCNILISIHHNALPDNEDPLKHRGVGIYYTHNFVKPLAKLLLASISKSSGLKQYGIFTKNFALTRPDFCYSVLIECGFLTHPIEAEHITQKKTQEKIVRGIVKWITTLKKNV